LHVDEVVVDLAEVVEELHDEGGFAFSHRVVHLIYLLVIYHHLLNAAPALVSHNVRTG